MTWIWFTASLLAFAAGFALHRGGICAVAAVREAIEEKKWARFFSFLECAAWALIVLLIADAAGAMAIGAWPSRMSIPAAMAGGALFGAGALINGACAFGSASRLAAGETSFLVLVLGFVLGAILALQMGLGADIALRQATAAPQWTLAAIALGLAAFAVWRIWTAFRAAPTPAKVAERIASPHWPPALAMAVIGLANVGLLLMVLNWPYTSLLVDVSIGRGMAYAARAGLVVAFLGGAMAGAVSAGRFKLRGPRGVDIAQRLGGGVLMGFGGVMIPGGNDGLVLVGLPLLQPTAAAAYTAMILVIAAGFYVRLLARRRSAA